MNKIDISICASAIRTKWWQEFYNSLKGNSVKYEVIFVGNKKPEFELPYNFKWIYSKECPAKCYQIAFDNAQGELINWTADDVTYSQNALDIAYDFFHIFDNGGKIIVAFNCIENGSPTSKGHRIDKENSPLMAPIGLINREWLNKLGGYDERFYCGQSENDLTMRMYEIDGGVEICREATVYIEHNQKHEGKSIFRTEDGFDYHKKDRRFLESCWIKSDGSISKTRLLPFKGF